MALSEHESLRNIPHETDSNESSSNNITLLADALRVSKSMIYHYRAAGFSDVVAFRLARESTPSKIDPKSLEIADRVLIPQTPHQKPETFEPKLKFRDFQGSPGKNQSIDLTIWVGEHRPDLAAFLKDKGLEDVSFETIMSKVWHDDETVIKAVVPSDNQNRTLLVLADLINYQSVKPTEVTPENPKNPVKESLFAAFPPRKTT